MEFTGKVSQKRFTRLLMFTEILKIIMLLIACQIFTLKAPTTNALDNIICKFVELWWIKILGLHVNSLPAVNSHEIPDLNVIQEIS